VLSVHTFVFCRTTKVDKGKHDYGPQNMDPDPCLANSSVFSLPSISISQCPGTHCSFTLLLVESSSKECQHCDTNDEGIEYVVTLNGYEVNEEGLRWPKHALGSIKVCPR
jgi:hypothetical protein